MPEVLEVELISQRRAIVLKAAHDLLLFLHGEEGCRAGIVVHDEKGGEGDDDGGKTFNDEDPRPTGFAAQTVHLHDTTGEQTTKGSSGRGGGEEDGHTQSALVTLVPHGDVVGNSGEETTLGETQCATCGDETGKVGDKTHAHAAYTPGDHDGWDPDRGAEALHGQIRRDFCRHIEGEKDGHSDLEHIQH